MDVLVTGGAGYIGAHIVLELIDQGFNVTVFDDLSSGDKDNIIKDTDFIQGSTLSKLDLSRLFRGKSFGAVIHLAASKSAGESMINPFKYSENNIVGGINLINACCEHNTKFFIFSSSAAVYGSTGLVSIDESYTTSPINFYGYTKLILEQNLQWFSHLNGLNYASLRYFNAAGYDIKKRIKSLEKKPQNLIPIVMEAAIGDRSEVQIYGNDYNTPDGTGIRDYVHVNDLAKAHIDAIDYLYNKEENLIINLGTGRGVSVLEVINQSKKICNKNIRQAVKGRRLGDSDMVVAKAELAKELINWDPQFSSLETIISSSWEVFRLKYSD